MIALPPVSTLFACLALAAGRPVETGAGQLPPRVSPISAIAPVTLVGDADAGPVVPAVPLRVDDAAWTAMDTGDVAWLDQMPLSDGSTVDLRLTRVDPFTKDARIVVMEAGANGQAVERALPRPHVSAWAGTVAGRPAARRPPPGAVH